MLINSTDIKKTTKGYRVDKKIAGHPRLRKTFGSYEEAENVLTKYLKGEGETVAAIAALVTWRTLFDLTVKKQWRHGKSTKQQDNAERAIKNYLGWDTDVREFDQQGAEVLSDKLEEDIPTLTTVSRYLSAVRCMLKQGQEAGLITWKVPKLAHYTQTNERINFFEYEDEERIVNIMTQADRADMADLFKVLIETGLRTSEGQYLKWRDVDMEYGLIRIWGANSKTGISRRVPITERCREVLLSLPRDDERVFPLATESRLRTTWKAVRAGMGNFDKDFIWYTTRHTCASRLMRAGVDIQTIQTWLGHARIETTMRYIQFSTGSLVNASDALDNARGTKREPFKPVLKVVTSG
ncbi:tyrosine-type recombinase/integrase [Amphritea sp. HPY]|uniref:tyrosine-type recombinase/integrase n=1 Tax=Amphritea sp. HPY TaxID=3421652 RepID=UPI003D7C5730